MVNWTEFTSQPPRDPGKRLWPGVCASSICLFCVWSWRCHQVGWMSSTAPGPGAEPGQDFIPSTLCSSAADVWLPCCTPNWQSAVQGALGSSELCLHHYNLREELLTPNKRAPGHWAVAPRDPSPQAHAALMDFWHRSAHGGHCTIVEPHSGLCDWLLSLITMTSTVIHTVASFRL